LQDGGPLSFLLEERVRMYNLLLLLSAIVLEICGDASIRVSLRSGKIPLFLFGSVLLIAYGSLVSFPNWTFSRTMGVYIAIFFIVSQLVAVLVLHEKINLPAIVGGLLIVSGGVVILVWMAEAEGADSRSWVPGEPTPE
jgi:drug/metabolite transporter superfamily protein YnfA